MKIQQNSKLAPTQQPSKGAQIAGKYYRTRSLSQNLQQIFNPNRQSISRSINNLSAVGGSSGSDTKSPSKSSSQKSLPQSPLVDNNSTSPFFPPIKIEPRTKISPSVTLSPPASNIQVRFPMFHFPQTLPLRPSEPVKLKGFILGERRKNKYSRSISVELPKMSPTLEKCLILERRRNTQDNSRFQLNDVVRENDELLRKYTDTAQSTQHDEQLSWQSNFKAKFASLFKNKKKYTIAEPDDGQVDDNVMHRCPSCNSLPSLMSSKREKIKNGTRKSLRQMKRSNQLESTSKGRYGKLKPLNLMSPHMIGGSFDNLLLVNRKKNNREAMGTYDTYHGGRSIGHVNRIKALYKYPRKPSESDDATTTTLSFDYDSGDVSDASSLEGTTGDEDGELSSFSDLTTQSSSRGYKMRSSMSFPSMPHRKPLRTETKTFLNNKPDNAAASFRIKRDGILASVKPIIPNPFHLTHQMSAPSLYQRPSDFTMMKPMMMQQQQNYGTYQHKTPYFHQSYSVPPTTNHSPSMMKGPMIFPSSGSSNDFPLVSPQ